jgi:acyl phosphate:glycerol-3-phosphate acyltransferase
MVVLAAPGTGMNEVFGLFFILIPLIPLLVFMPGYLVGSVPAGPMIASATGASAAEPLVDGLSAAAIVLLAMIYGKGVPTFLAPPEVFIALGLFFGRIYPFRRRGKGGKGAASFVGVVTALALPLGAVFCVTWLAMVFLSRSISLSTLVAAAVVVAGAYIVQALPWRWVHLSMNLSPMIFLAMTSLLYWRHGKDIVYFVGGAVSGSGGKD